ncbi:vitellogenin-1 [Gracilaria domingensis]|nr:vitellogenin-1 [Gracilaria domingensis]
MSPAPRHLSRRLPLSSQQLSAFDKARRAKTVAEKRDAVNSLVSASFSKGVSIQTDAAKYVLNRLLNAVSVSANHTRLNSSTALIAFIRAVQKAAPKTTEQQMISAILKLYGTDGSFEVDYPSGERERAIGTVTACAALVRAYDGKLQPATSKEIISLLRPCATGNCAKWQLANSCVYIVIEVLRASGSRAVHDACAKSLWQWCEERKDFDDGLSLVLNLLKLNIASQSAIQRIYPDLDSVAKALTSTFETGFSRRSGDLEGASVVPLSWKLAFEYAFSPDGQNHLGSSRKFWKRVVSEGLIHSGGSLEKKILALDLLQLTVPHIEDESTFEAVFDSSLSSLINILRSKRKTRGDDIVVKGIKAVSKARQYMNKFLSGLGESIAEKISQSAPSKKSTSFLQLLFLWGVRNGVIEHVFPPGKLNETLPAIKNEEIISLFCSTINEFACPKSEKSRLSVQAIRMHAKRFSFKLASMFPFLVNDTVRIFLFYAVSDDSCYQSLVEGKGEVLKLDVYKPPLNASLVCGLVPLPSPPISLDIAGSVFAKLIGFISEVHNKDNKSTLVSFCYDHLKLILSWKGIRFRIQQVLEGGDELEVSGKDFSETVVHPVLKSLSKARQTANKGVIDALQLLAEVLGLVFFRPFVRTRRQIESGFRDRRFCISSVQEVSQVISLLRDDRRMDISGQGSGNKEKEKQPDATERVTKLLCEICARSETVPNQIALRVINEMSSSVDDRVVAVLFDVMDEILQSNRSLGEYGEDEDSDELEEENHASASDGSDSEESNSEMQVDSEEHEAETNISLPERDEELPKAHPVEVASGEESGSDSEIDMDIDDEDPAVLEALDKRLVTHMKLVLEERNSTSRKKRGPQAQFAAVRRILSVIEEVAKSLRLRLASDNDDGRTGIVFLDLQCRLYEFVMNDTNFNGQFLENVCSIVSKQMLLPLSVFQDKVADADTATQIAGRFLNSLSLCKVERSLSDSEVQTISKSAACIVGVAAILSKDNYEQFFPQYQKLAEIMLKTSSPMLRPRMLSPFFSKAPSLSLSLFSTVIENLEGPEATRKQLARGSEIILQLARLTRERNCIPAEKCKEFWASLNQFLQKHCERGFKGWNAVGMDNIIQAILLGSTEKLMVLSNSDRERFLTVLKTKAPRRSTHRLQKLWRSTSPEVKPSELLEDGSLRHEADLAKKRVSKKRKLQ